MNICLSCNDWAFFFFLTDCAKLCYFYKCIYLNLSLCLLHISLRYILDFWGQYEYWYSMVTQKEGLLLFNGLWSHNVLTRTNCIGKILPGFSDGQKLYMSSDVSLALLHHHLLFPSTLHATGRSTNSSLPLVRFESCLAHWSAHICKKIITAIFE